MEPPRFAFVDFLCYAKEQNNYDIWIFHTFSYKMMNNLSSICYLNQELLTAESSAGNLIQHQCRYSRQFVILKTDLVVETTVWVYLISQGDLI